MSAPADNPYSRFLGLPEQDQPPHFYALLELELFCSQPERIEHAVRKQFRRIKPYEDHVDRATREAVQDVMNRIATARVVLTNADQKEAYDIDLARELGVDRDEVLRSRPATPLPEYELTITAGPALVGARISLLSDAAVTIGRDPACVVALDSPRAAPLHCQLRYSGQDWVFEQVNDALPSLVNDQRATRFVLADGDAIEAGGYRFRFTRLVRTANVVGTSQLPPISLTMQAGPSVHTPNFAALPPESILIGHCDTALWQLPDPMISRHHCRIEPLGEDWVIADLRSTNGTFVGGRQVTRPCILRHRDRITLGRFDILVGFRR